MENKTEGNMIIKKEITRGLRYRNTALSKWVDISEKLVSLSNVIRKSCGYCKLFDECIICPMRKEGVCGITASGLTGELGGSVFKAYITSSTIERKIEADIEAYKKDVKEG